MVFTGKLLRQLGTAASFAASLTFGASALAADPPSNPAGDYSENLSFNLKTGGHSWRLDKTYNPPGNVMMEWVPEGQTGQNWTEMITSITFTSRPEPNTGAIIGGIVKNFRSICAKVDILDSASALATDRLRQSVGSPAQYQTYSVLMRCDDPKPSPNPAVTVKKHEVLWIKGMQGWLYSYIVERAWHGDDITPNSILASDDTRKEWKDWGDNVEIAGIPRDKLPAKSPK